MSLFINQGPIKFGLNKNESLSKNFVYRSPRIVTPACLDTSSRRFPVMSISTKSRQEEVVVAPPRRTANYQAPNWEFNYVQSLRNEYSGESYVIVRDELRKQVEKILWENEMTPLEQLQFIDDLQRLGVSYHFENQIKSIIGKLHEERYIIDEEDLYAVALGFRLMRQHGFLVSEDVLDCFKDEKGEFKLVLFNDVNGMLQVYEACNYLTQNESKLESAREFAAKHLHDKLINDEKMDTEIRLLVEHALKIPIHWRVPRVEARWFIDLYEKRSNKNNVILKLAKYDFNIVQSIHQNDLKLTSRWWESTGLGSKLEFARDRLVENFFWTIGVNFRPEYGYCRRMSTVVNALITTIDDVYDVYGTLEELELFTNAVERWNIEVIDDLPEYKKICYFALYNATNEMAYNAMKEKGAHIIPYLRKAWADICKTYLKEAKWYHSGYTPTLQEYIDNAWISISAPVILVHGYFFVTNTITTDALENLFPYHDIIRHSSVLLRLADDLGTSTEELERGDVPKAVECYMNEAGVSKKEAREYINFLIGETWKKFNKERASGDSPFPDIFFEIAMNLGRMAQCMYEYGDGHGHNGGNTYTKERIKALLFDPIVV